MQKEECLTEAFVNFLVVHITILGLAYIVFLVQPENRENIIPPTLFSFDSSFTVPTFEEKIQNYKRRHHHLPANVGPNEKD